MAIQKKGEFLQDISKNSLSPTIGVLLSVGNDRLMLCFRFFEMPLIDSMHMKSH